MREVSRGGRFVPRCPLKLGRDAPRKLATRGISESEVRARISDHFVIDADEEHGWTTETIERMLAHTEEDGP